MTYNIILASAMGSLSSYLPYIIVIVAVLTGICLMNWYRSRKAEDHYLDTLTILNKGTKVKTMFGIYGEVVETKNFEDTKIVVLKLYDGTKIEIDARAIFGLDERGQLTQSAPEKTTEEIIEEISKEKPKRTRKPKSE